MSRLPPELAELLRRVAAEEGERDAQARARLSDWPEQRESIQEWLSTLEQVREGLREDREILRELESRPVDEGDLALVKKFVERQARAPARWSAAPWLRAAAAVLVALGLAWWLVPRGDDPGRDDPPTWLAAPLDGLAPRGELPPDAEPRFEWEPYELPPFGTFRLTVEDAGGAPLFPPPSTSEPWYSPAQEEAAALRSAGRFVWRVEALDGNGRRIAWGSEFVEAWFSGN